MNSPQFALKLASAIFGLVSLAHLLRLLTGISVKIGSYDVALWTSAAGLVLAGLLIPVALIVLVICLETDVLV